MPAGGDGQVAEPLDVSVCIVTKDRMREMLRCLDAIALQEGVHAEVVIIVRDTSTQPVAEACRERGATMAFPVRVEVMPGSVAHRRTRAAELAQAPIIAWTDSDCIPQPGWLARGVAAFADAQLGVAQGRTEPEPVDAGWWPATQDIPVFSGRYETCNIFYRREALLEAGAFNDEVFGWFCEDMAAGLAVRRHGWEATFLTDAVVVHETVPAGPGWHIRRSRDYDQWNLLARHFPEVRELFWHRWFLRRRDAYVAAAACGIAGSLVWRPAALAALPWLASRRPGRLTPTEVQRAGALLAFDAACCYALWRGSVKNRSVVL